MLVDQGPWMVPVQTIQLLIPVKTTDVQYLQKQECSGPLWMMPHAKLSVVLVKQEVGVPNAGPSGVLSHNLVNTPKQG